MTKPLSPHRTFDDLSELSARAAAAIIAQTGLQCPPANEHLRGVLSAPPGERGAFLADPVLEAAFGYETADKTMGELEPLLGARLIDALHGEGRKSYRFEKAFHPYTHQMAAWGHLLAEDARSVLVSAGTGSGKTECFMVPMLRDLTREAEGRGRLTGVRALMLYPLNALIESQKERLSAWTAPFGSDVRFALYNGETKREPDAKAPAPKNQVTDRETLRGDPPPVLVTNITMLEYMLIRQLDASILKSSQGKLRWLILDEAHSYIGSQAAEVALMLRRVMRAFGVTPSEVRFAATSATLATSSASPKEKKETEQALRGFLRDLSGMPDSSVHVVTGKRFVPDLAGRKEGGGFGALASDAKACRLRELLEMRPAVTLSDAARAVFADPVRRGDVLTLAEAGARAVSDVTKERFSPVRIHLVHRAQPGFWVCPDRACAGRKGTPLDDNAWPFGLLHVEERATCQACEAPLFELATCTECGQPHLLAEEGEADPDHLARPTKDEAHDEFSEGVDAPDEPSPLDEGGRAKLIVSCSGDQTVAFDPRTSKLCDRASGDTIMLRLKGGRSCAACEGALRTSRFSAPFLLGNLIPPFLELFCDPADVEDDRAKEAVSLPAGGRRLITFTDSRQGTARFSARLQQDAERNLVRSFLYHLVQSGEDSEANSREKQRLRTMIAQLENAGVESGGTDSPLRDVLRDNRTALAELEAGAATGTSIPWVDAVRRFTDATWVPQFETLWENAWKHRGTEEDFAEPQRLARILMTRELYRRPRAANTVETMGLIRLVYTAIEDLQEKDLPDAFRARGMTIQDWRDYLYAFEATTLRGRGVVRIENADKQWLGETVYGKVVRRPDDRAKTDKKRYVNWPTAEVSAGTQSLAVDLLKRGLKLDWSGSEHQGEAEACLRAAFEVFKPGAGPLCETEGGYVLDLAKARLARVDEAQVCRPRSDVLARPFLGLPLRRSAGDSEAPCDRVTMPRHPHAFPFSEEARAEVEGWLQEDEKVQHLRGLNAWTDLHDRAARFAPLILSAEHSAQQPSWRLRLYEKEFTAGRLNILNCSTTMEMGVDIGGLQAVVNANVPPSPASYRQRVGRAGRRDEAVSVALTFAKAEPFGWRTYLEPTLPLTAPLASPKVVLSSATIARRHVNAAALAAFLAETVAENPTEMTAGELFGRSLTDTKPRKIDALDGIADRFVAWAESLGGSAAALDEDLADLVRGTPLEGQKGLALVASEAVKHVQEDWLREWEAVARGYDGTSSKVTRRVLGDLSRLARANALGELAARGFLPGHGFPTHVVPMLLSEQSDRRNEAAPESENRFLHREAPSRSLEQAIRDYAPGTQVVLDGLVYRSAGVLRDWRPGKDHEARALSWAWRCNRCDAAGDAVARPEICSDCGRDDLERIEHLRPGGFRAERRAPGTDVSRVDYVPPLPPFVSAAGAPWVPLRGERTSRARSQQEALVFHRSAGLHQHGYALCLACGRAAPEEARGPRIAEEPLPPMPPSMVGHRPLEGGPDNGHDGICQGNDEEGRAIKRHLRLGHTTLTSAFELQLPGLGGEEARGAALALAVALREALCRRLGVESAEIGFHPAWRRAEQGKAWSILLFDQASGGAGLATRTSDLLEEVLRGAERILNCPEACAKGCSACILTYDARHQAGELDRRRALSFLSGSGGRPGLLDRLSVPEAARVFGEGTVALDVPLAEAIRSYAGEGARVTLYLGGDAASWEPAAWPGRALAERLLGSGSSLSLTLAKASYEGLTGAQRFAVASLCEREGVTLHAAEKLPQRKDRYLLAAVERTGEPSRLFAGGAIPPSMSEGWGTGGELVVRGEGAPPARGAALTASEIRPPVGDDVRRLTVTGELDGPVTGFGKAFWQALTIACPETRELARRGPPDAVTYEDRYLRSPLTARLLYEVLKAAPCSLAGSALSVVTAKRHPGDDRTPRLIEHDWQSENVHRDVLELLLGTLTEDVSLAIEETRRTEHRRGLQLSWGDERFEVTLDQGFGYWRVPVRMPFGFAVGAENQAEALIRANFAVTGRRDQLTTLDVCA